MFHAGFNGQPPDRLWADPHVQAKAEEHTPPPEAMLRPQQNRRQAVV
ncbi:hypothetical protein D3OALGA1CA_4459 [Olavius algarvensis associated proteobacterium Delta 3]|nr:hypothetical protein D3OALGB2SA_3661 [Olavius algarvensis associated proteobacterium Delta 3]CAB5151617.1 hypothetical protein D3OALGA1CA_4459 [Olavius algarvensis associated proteobacterium Delta 3]